jgi:hypothetical protein
MMTVFCLVCRDVFVESDRFFTQSTYQWMVPAMGPSLIWLGLSDMSTGMRKIATEASASPTKDGIVQP